MRPAHLLVVWVLVGCDPHAATEDASARDAGSLDAARERDAGSDAMASDAMAPDDAEVPVSDDAAMELDAGADAGGDTSDAGTEEPLDSGADGGPPDGGIDGGIDGGRLDSGFDGGLVDGGADGGALRAPADFDFCADHVIDDTLRGTRDGNRTTVRVAMSELVRNRTSFGTPLTDFAAICGTSAIGATGWLIAIRHVMTRTAPVRVDIVDDDGDLNARADAWIADRCTVYSAPPLDCARELDPRGSQQHMHTLTERPLGTEIVVFVSYLRPYGGTFRVTITELETSIAVGDPCVPLGDVACAPGASCVTDSRCTQNGTMYAACRGAGVPCDPGLGCTRSDPTQRDAMCVPAAPLGGLCTSFGVCVEGAACSSGRCVPIGGDGLPCRDAAPRCDAGLTCWSDAYGAPPMCRRVLALDAPCSRYPGSTGEVCPEGAWCALEVASSSAGRCRPLGARHALCRDAEPFCDATLACERVCEPLVGLGEWCAYNQAVCAEGLHCRSTCQLPGTLDMPCRDTGAACDPGLVCSQSQVCRFSVPLGGSCGASNDDCAPGGSCTYPGPTCVPTGSAGAACRASGPACDPGLACTYMERCRPIVPEGGACHLALTNDVCAPGTACVRVGDSARCTRIGALDGPCRPEGVPCDAPLRCTALPWLVRSRCVP